VSKARSQKGAHLKSGRRLFGATDSEIEIAFDQTVQIVGRIVHVYSEVCSAVTIQVAFDGDKLGKPDEMQLKRAQKLQGGRNNYRWDFGPRAWKRIQKELSDKKKKSD
jgi:hypothetical protein